ncbi:MAG: MoaD/ThiS family protein [Desulfobacteraceae bacterium]|nr:MoaD/ThiS family protein [Desulfobacteraceae bacterium]
MVTITFNAFSFLQKKLKAKNIPCQDVAMEISNGMTCEDLIQQVSLKKDEVEVVFVNGKVVSKKTIIGDRDRVALVPHGTPGPYRVLLGFMNKDELK